VNGVLVLLVSSVSIFTLNANREHFSLLYNSHYQRIVADAGLHPNRPKLVDSHHEITEYYQIRYKPRLELEWCDSFENEIKFRNFIKVQVAKNESIYFGAWSKTNPNYTSIIKEYYPNEIVKNYLGGSTHLFHQSGESTDMVLSDLNFVETELLNWTNINEFKVVHNERHYYTLDSTNEWSPTFKAKLKDIATHKSNVIRASVRVKPIDGISDMSLVAVIEENGETKHWSNVEFSRFVEYPNDQWQVVHQGINLSDVSFGDEATITFFVWNKGKRKILLDDFEILRVEGNTYKYGLRDEF
jgi:hypothetical protein